MPDPVTGSLAAQVQSILWYHTLQLGDVVTPGWFDLRPIVDRLPWPDLRGKRCLDVGTYDGFLAFEMERRGAAEVVAIDIFDHQKWDWPPDMRATGATNLALLAGEERGSGFRLAHETLGSRVELRQMSAYDLDPDDIGTFDVITCGTLLLHLRDPQRALEAIRTVCRGVFLSCEQIDLSLTVRNRRDPIARLNGSGSLCQWWVPNSAGHRRMVHAAGFEIERGVRPYAVPFGSAHPPRSAPRDRAAAAFQRVLLGNAGLPHSAVLARPRV
jgi:tRNA (mo5U34)-methyltransferase